MNRLAKQMGWGHLAVALAMVCSSTAAVAMNGYTQAVCGGAMVDPVNFNFSGAWTASHALADWQSTTNCGAHMTYSSNVGNYQYYWNGVCDSPSYQPAAPRANWNRYHAREFVGGTNPAVFTPTHYDYGCTSSADTADGANFEEGKQNAWSWMINNCTGATQYYLTNTQAMPQGCGVATNAANGYTWQIN